jgi:hypothetical protein
MVWTSSGVITVVGRRVLGRLDGASLEGDHRVEGEQVVRGEPVGHHARAREVERLGIAGGHAEAGRDRGGPVGLFRDLARLAVRELGVVAASGGGGELPGHDEGAESGQPAARARCEEVHL